jgi:hypothetical protein
MRYTLEVNLSARNVSTKDILLVVAEINARSAVFNVHGTRSDDYFFESGDFSPLTTESISFSTQSAQPKIMYPSSEPLSVSSEIAFVQFADGSTWGDRAAAQDALRIRRLTSLQLTNLADIYRIAGEKGFVGELMKPSELPVIGILQRACGTDGKDVKTVAMMVQDMLELARSRQLPDSGILRSAFFQAQQWH